MFCPNCGEKNPDNAVFCQECGKKMTVEEKQVKSEERKRTETPKRNSITKKQKIILAECIILVIAIACAYQLGKKKLGVEAVATQYFKEVMNGDWEKVYDKLELEQSEFLTKEEFVKANQEIGSKEVTTFHVSKDEMVSGKEDIKKEVEVVYYLKGDTNESTMEIDLIKQPKKKFFFFDTWKVLPKEYIAEKYSIDVPKGATVKIDSMKLDKKYLDTSSEEDSGNRDYYVIPKLFAGTHKLTLKKENMNDVTTTITTESGSYYLETMKLKKEIKEELVKKAAEDLRMLYNEALAQSGFDAVKYRFAQGESEESDMRTEFDSIKENLNGTNGENRLKSIAFSDIKGVVEEEALAYRVDLSYTYKIKAKPYSFWGEYQGESYDETENDSKDSIYYVYKEGKWLIKTLYVNQFYY